MDDFVKNNQIRVLVVAPHHEIKNYSFHEWAKRVSNLTYPRYNILIADNSPTNKNKKKIVSMGFDAIHIKPKHKANQQYIAESHDALRVQALANNYDFILHLETDVIPPHDIIERLLVHRKTVVSAPYFIKFGEESHLMIQNIENIGGTLKYTTNIEDGHDIQYFDGQLKEIYACGLGCCLIHKSVLKKIKFRWEQGASMHPDSFFAADLKLLGVKQYLDTSILCEHRNSSWSKVVDVFHGK